MSLKPLSSSHLVLGDSVGLTQFHCHKPFLKTHNENCSQETGGTEVSNAVIKNY